MYAQSSEGCSCYLLLLSLPRGLEVANCVTSGGTGGKGAESADVDEGFRCKERANKEQSERTAR